MEFDISQIMREKENSTLEAKSAANGIPRSIWETYSAFANTDGGIILLGVSEDSSHSLIYSGVENVDAMLKEFWDTINNPNKVSINLLTSRDISVLKLSNGKSVIQIKVPRANRLDKPIFINDNLFSGTYKRNHEGDYHCPRNQVMSMVRDSKLDSIDKDICIKFKVKDLNESSVRKYRRIYNDIKSTHAWIDLSDEDFLMMIGAADKSYEDGLLHPTIAGLLMFGNEYQITSVFPQYFLDYREYLDSQYERWSDRIQSASGDWSGNLFDFFYKVAEHLVSDLPKPFMLNGMQRIDDTPVHKAVREALLNCIVNADYYQRMGLVVLKHKKEIVLENPGNIRIGKERMLRGGSSDPRNSTILKMFNFLGFGERADSGVPQILSTWKRAGYIAPTIEELDISGTDRTKTVLSFEKNLDNYADATQIDKIPTQLSIYDTILNAIRNNPDISQSKLARELDININTMKYYIRQLEKKCLLSRDGSRKSGGWIVK